MPSTPDFYVQATPKLIEHLSGQPVAEKTIIIEVPGPRIDRYRKENPNESPMSDEACAEYLAREIVITAMAEVTNIGGGWQTGLSECNALPDRPQVTRERTADFHSDGMQAWIL
jgi:hypothetical protein